MCSIHTRHDKPQRRTQLFIFTNGRITSQQFNVQHKINYKNTSLIYKNNGEKQNKY